MRIAVTGATGFIGRYLVAELVRLEISPTLVCRPLEVIPPSLAKHPAVAFDLRSPPADAYQLMGEPETLVHLAWGGLPNYQSLHHFEEELPSQYGFLKALIEHGLKNLVVTGTCFEYGMQPGSLREDLEARPENPYGFAKNALRLQLEHLQRVKPFNITWARLFYMFGDGQSPNSLWSQIKRTVEQGAHTFDMSGGEQLRDYLPVALVAKHLVSLTMMTRDLGCVNVCSGTPVSVRRLVEGWITENGWRLDLNLGHYPYPEHEPLAFWGDRTKLDHCLQAP